MKRILVIVLVVAVVVLATGFTLLNPGAVELDIYLRQLELPLALLVFLSIVLGALLGLLAGLGMVVRRQAEIRRLRKKLALSEQEVLNLRNIPIKDRH